jgi:hypothetical protein
MLLVDAKERRGRICLWYDCDCDWDCEREERRKEGPVRVVRVERALQLRGAALLRRRRIEG